MANSITTLSLCSGVGWLDEAVGAGCRYFGWRHRVAAYCEWEAYAAAVLLERMEESSLEPAPVWSGDLGQFDGAAFRGAVDGITAGFPCQPWSAAGKQLGTEDERWLWPAIVRLIDDVEPGFVFLENVSALIAGGGLEHVLSDFAKRGFDAEWCCLTAEAVGAAHRRERVFILAYEHGARWREMLASAAGWRQDVAGFSEGVADTAKPRGWGLSESAGRSADPDSDGGSGGQLGDATCERAESGKQCGRLSGDQFAGENVAHAERAIARTGTGQERPAGERGNRPSVNGDAVANAIKPVVQQAEAGRPRKPRGTAAARSGNELGNTASDDERRDSISAMHRQGESTGGSGGSLFAPGPGADWSGIHEALWPATERGVRVLVDGRAVVLDASRADQLRCSGNGVVALQGAVAFVELVRRAMK